MSIGYLKFYRQLIEHKVWFLDRFSRGQAWVDLIALASFADTYFFIGGYRVDVKRGQLAWSILKLSKRWWWDRDTVKRFLNFLDFEGMISYKCHNRTTLITIVNYEKWQNNTTPDAAPDTTPDTTPDAAHNKKYKKNNNKNIYTGFFDEVWEMYPNKDGKAQALRHFKKSVLTESDYLNIKKALENYLDCSKVKSGYIKNGSTWFNNWRDWIEPTDAMMGNNNGNGEIDQCQMIVNKIKLDAQKQSSSVNQSS